VSQTGIISIINTKQIKHAIITFSFFAKYKSPTVPSDVTKITGKFSLIFLKKLFKNPPTQLFKSRNFQSFRLFGL